MTLEEIKRELTRAREYLASRLEGELTEEEFHRVRGEILGREGVVRRLTSSLRELPREERARAGRLINEFKAWAEQQLSRYKPQPELKLAVPDDPTVPAFYRVHPASLHPVSATLFEICDVLAAIGFEVVEGPEIETDWHNFTALNIPEDHPARDMQDTLYVDVRAGWLLRTHTSPVQVRTLLSREPPFRVCAPGRVYRNETISARSHVMFHQVEGLVVSEEASLAELKGVLVYLVRSLMGEKAGVRFRASYFPFTEPSMEVDVSCVLCGGKGCSVCKGTGWVEVLGCGMVHPAVFENCGVDSRRWRGYAFGLGVERIAMLRYGISDIRDFFVNDRDFLTRFALV